MTLAVDETYLTVFYVGLAQGTKVLLYSLTNYDFFFYTTQRYVVSVPFEMVFGGYGRSRTKTGEVPVGQC